MKGNGKMTTEERLARLERNNRRLTWALALTGLVAMLIVTTGMAPTDAVPRQVKAGRFEVVDANGQVRALLGISGAGPGFCVYDEKGKVRAQLTVTKDGPRFTLADEIGSPRVAVLVNKNVAGVGILDEKGRVLRELK
jgi:hypothetical protein